MFARSGTTRMPATSDSCRGAADTVASKHPRPGDPYLSGRPSNNRSASDLAGLNNLTRATTLAAVGGVKLGRAVSLACPIAYGVTADNLAPARHNMTETGDAAPSGGLSFAMDQIGMNIHVKADTRIDALSQVICDGRLYHNRPADIVSGTGAAERSIVAAGEGIVGRGVLLDGPRARRVPWLEPGDQVNGRRSGRRRRRPAGPGWPGRSGLRPGWASPATLPARPLGRG
jgi:hypothetical protein